MMSIALNDIRLALLGGHIYEGLCPDAAEGLDVRDPMCPACRALVAIDEVRNGQQPANVYEVAAEIEARYKQDPTPDNHTTLIANAIRNAEARGNHRALDLQYALDAEHAAHQPIAIDSGELPEAFARALWWRRGHGWQAGYHTRRDGTRYVMLDHGSAVPLDMFTHWIPEIPDPNVTPPPAA
jgi:hypothetical protein